MQNGGIAVTCSPLLKWPGGKRGLLPQLLPLLPESPKRYFEPFVGGGAVFFALTPAVAVLTDTDPDLINCYVQVRDNPSGVIAILRRLKNSEEDYYRVRAARPRTASGKAARLIYLSTLAFNGIHRNNLNGEFNVPYGRKTHLSPYDPERLVAVSVALQAADIRCQDFEAAVADANKWDVVYLDPPYTVAHGNNGFLKYNAKIFSWQDQIRLARVAAQLAKRGCQVIVSNADHSSILKLYSSFKMVRVERHSRIAASVDYRRKITECIFHS